LKNPNGYGSVVKLSGNRRNPYAVRKTIGWNEKGHPIYLSIGYTETREEGMIMLAEYNKSPWDIDAGKTTLEDLWKLFQEKKMPKGKSTQGALKTAYKHTSKYHKMKYKDIKSFHMQDCIDNCGFGYSTQWAIKNLFSHLDKFALEIDVINKSYAVLTTAEPIPETNKKPFTDEEVDAVWKIKDKEWVDSILFFLYTGFRLNEMLSIETLNVDLQNRTIQGGVKTNAGKDRIIPIHSKIFELVKRRVDEGNEYLFSHNGKKCSEYYYYKYWNSIMDELKIEHTPHECRHTFRSRLDSAGANKVCIDLMMGHKSKEVGERVYTHKTIEELKEAIELITH
jgi:integrase